MYKLSATGTSVALNATGLASAVAYSGGGYALSATTPGDNLGHIITIAGKAATNHSGKTFTVTGTDADGKFVSQGIPGPNGVATVSTTQYFATVSSITVSATTGADTFDLGWTAASVSPIMLPIRPVKYTYGQFLVGFGCIVGTGSPTYTVQHTYEGATWFNHSVVASKTANAEGSYTVPVLAIRLSWTAAGQVTFAGLQPGDLT